MPAVEPTSFTLFLVMLANSILFAINLDAFTLELRHVPCHFGTRDTPFREHDTIIRLENSIAIGAASGQYRGVGGCELIDLGDEGQNMGIPRINFVPVSIDFHVIKFCPGRSNNNMWQNPVVGSSAGLNVIHNSLTK